MLLATRPTDRDGFTAFSGRVAVEAGQQATSLEEVRLRAARRLAFVGTLLALSPAVLRAQSTEPPFITALVARLDRLRQDSVIQRHVGKKGPLELFALIKPDAIGRITDAELLDFGRVFIVTLAHADTTTCADMWRKGFQNGFEALARQMNATDAEGWARWQEHMVWASILDRPLGPMAPATEVQAAFMQMGAGLGAAERASVVRAYRKVGGSDETCRFMRGAYEQILRLPPERAARIFRGAMYGSGA